LGLLLLLITVILWTASNFLASTLFADNTYSKPYFVTYINTTVFILPLVPLAIRRISKDPRSIFSLGRKLKGSFATRYATISQEDEAIMKPDSPEIHVHGRNHHVRTTSASNASEDMLLGDPMESSQVLSIPIATTTSSAHLSFPETARLSLEFCILWFLANYFVAGCLEYTTVSSSTILTSTSSVFTLLFGTLFRVERFSVRKLLGVLASLTGIVLISTVDLSGKSDENRGNFPHKTIEEIAIGDGMALFSALLYGVYAVFMKKRIGDESRVNMPLFFGLVGLFNVILLWPGFIILHITGIETFELPSDGWIWSIILINSCSSLIADFAWAYAVLLTSPIVVTVGLSTTIPLSLIGQIVLNSQHASFVYWVGACIVVLSFLIVNEESAQTTESTAGEAPMSV